MIPLVCPAPIATRDADGIERGRVRGLLCVPPAQCGGGAMIPLVCPAPIATRDAILLGQGSGVSAPMVSSEGVCAAHYANRRHSAEAVR